MSLYDVLKTIAPTYVNSSVQNISNMFDDNEETYARLGLSNQGGNLKIAYEFNEPIDIEEIVLLRRASTSVALNIKDVNNNTIVYGAGTTFPLTGIVSLELVSTANNYVQSDVFIFKVFTRVIYDNKSLISLSDGYVKLNEGSPSSPEVLLTENMSSNTQNGITVSSSSIRDSTFEAYKALDSSDSSYWATSLGTLTGWLKISFPTPKSIGKYVMKSNASDNDTLMPSSWTFEGSNDENKWDVLDVQNDITNWNNIAKEFVLPNNNTDYLHYRINVTKNNGHSSMLGIKDIRIYSPLKSATPPSWKTVSPTLPTLTQFQEEGMDDLSILDRKVQKVIGGPFQMDDEGSLGEGKVFKGIVDLKKYFDLRKLEVK